MQPQWFMTTHDMEAGYRNIALSKPIYRSTVSQIWANWLLIEDQAAAVVFHPGDITSQGHSNLVALSSVTSGARTKPKAD